MYYAVSGFPAAAWLFSRAQTNTSSVAATAADQQTIAAFAAWTGGCVATVALYRNGYRLAAVILALVYALPFLYILSVIGFGALFGFPMPR
jgi:hypothetical protein